MAGDGPWQEEKRAQGGVGWGRPEGISAPHFREQEKPRLGAAPGCSQVLPAGRDSGLELGLDFGILVVRVESSFCDIRLSHPGGHSSRDLAVLQRTDF